MINKFSITDQTSETTEETKSNISPFLFAKIKQKNKMEDNEMPAIKTQELVKRYKNVTAVDKLDLEIQRGELFSLLGVNGATAVSWGDTAISRFTCSGSVVMLQPPTRASPPVGFVRQESILIAVVFPAPLTPNRENNSPR